MAFQEKFNFDRFVLSMLETLENVVQELSSFPLPSHSDQTTLCVFSSPWYASQTRSVKKTFETTTKITEKILEEIQNTEVEAFKQSELKSMGEDAVILEAETIQTKINGYETAHPFGKQANDMQTVMYISISPKSIIKPVTDKLRKHIHGNNLHFSSFSFCSFVAVRDIFHGKNFMLIDISGEVSDISIVKDHVLQETFSFPFGKNFLLRKIASETGHTFQEAISQFRMVSNLESNENNSKKILIAMEKAGKDWLLECKNALTPILENQEVLPHDVFITADEDVSMWFISNVQEFENSSFTFTDKQFSIKHLNPTFLSSFCESETGVERDPFIMIESLFVKRFI